MWMQVWGPFLLQWAQVHKLNTASRLGLGVPGRRTDVGTVDQQRSSQPQGTETKGTPSAEKGLTSSGHWEEWGGGQVWLDPGTQTTGSGYPPTPFCFCAGFFSPADRPPSRKKSRHLSHSSRVGPAHWVEPQRPCLDSGPPSEPGLALTRRVRLTDPAEDTASSGEDTAAPNPFHASHQPRVQGRHLRCSARHTVVLT